MNYDAIVKDEGYSGLNPVVFGYEECDKKHSFGPAIREYYLIHFVVAGYGKFEIGTKSYSIGPGDMFVIPPEEETYYEADSVNPWSYIWVGFTADSPLPFELGDVVRCPQAETIFEAMKNCETMTGGLSAYLAGKLWELFSLFLENEIHCKDYVESAVDCIHTEYMKNITVAKIAQRLNIDRTYFSTLFKNKMNISPKQYIMNYRMNIAVSLLTEKRKSVSVTALSVGYSDVFTFSKMFKRHFGVSPNEYVKRKLSEN